MITAFVFQDGSLTKNIHSGTANLAVAEALPAVDHLPSHGQAVAEHAAERGIDVVFAVNDVVAPGLDEELLRLAEVAAGIEARENVGA